MTGWHIQQLRPIRFSYSTFYDTVCCHGCLVHKERGGIQVFQIKNKNVYSACHHWYKLHYMHGMIQSWTVQTDGHIPLSTTTAKVWWITQNWWQQAQFDPLDESLAGQELPWLSLVLQAMAEAVSHRQPEMRPACQKQSGATEGGHLLVECLWKGRDTVSQVLSCSVRIPINGSTALQNVSSRIGFSLKLTCNKSDCGFCCHGHTRWLGVTIYTEHECNTVPPTPPPVS